MKLSTYRGAPVTNEPAKQQVAFL